MKAAFPDPSAIAHLIMSLWIELLQRHNEFQLGCLQQLHVQTRPMFGELGPLAQTVELYKDLLLRKPKLCMYNAQYSSLEHGAKHRRPAYNAHQHDMQRILLIDLNIAHPVPI